MMSAVQVLTHINTIAMGMVLKEMNVDPSELNRFSTPVFRTKRTLIEKIFSQNPGLYVEMIMRNRNSRHVIDLYEQVVSELKQMIVKEDAIALKKRINAASSDK
jgi:prephenate dehydrogenase